MKINVIFDDRNPDDREGLMARQFVTDLFAIFWFRSLRRIVESCIFENKI